MKSVARCCAQFVRHFALLSNNEHIYMWNTSFVSHILLSFLIVIVMHFFLVALVLALVFVFDYSDGWCVFVVVFLFHQKSNTLTHSHIYRSFFSVFHIQSRLNPCISCVLHCKDLNSQHEAFERELLQHTVFIYTHARQLSQLTHTKTIIHAEVLKFSWQCRKKNKRHGVQMH